MLDIPLGDLPAGGLPALGQRLNGKRGGDLASLMTAHPVSYCEQRVSDDVRVFIELAAQAYMRTVSVIDIRFVRRIGSMRAGDHVTIFARMIWKRDLDDVGRVR
ncbi:hypothetical protein GCM10025790_02350 [Nesterenkonia rhizosphaerae]|uniref:Thioesterase domain-containing protein n=1 Tax=Nesterenkonia rhizosphaerae TaxID=1348272 RepID=A0ABP9FQC7_9MICC